MKNSINILIQIFVPFTRIQPCTYQINDSSYSYLPIVCIIFPLCVKSCQHVAMTVATNVVGVH